MARKIWYVIIALGSALLFFIHRWWVSRQRVVLLREYADEKERARKALVTYTTRAEKARIEREIAEVDDEYDAKKREIEYNFDSSAKSVSERWRRAFGR